MNVNSTDSTQNGSNESMEHDWEKLMRFGDYEPIHWLKCRKCGREAWSDEINRREFEFKVCKES